MQNTPGKRVAAFVPGYRERLTRDELLKRAKDLRELMRECEVCPHACGAERLTGRFGVCRSASEMMISSASAHFGEEPPLTGTHGSGTVFFTSCNLKCTFCQNYDISQMRLGRNVTARQLAEIMIRLQCNGCHNINLVTPTHVVPHIVEALIIARDRELSIPLVYNCGGYESVHTLRFLEDVVDIYMPDIKYADNEAARKYSGAPEYWDVVRPAVREMHRQVGDLFQDERGIATRGLLIRHLVLPNRLAGSEKVLDFVAREVSVHSYVNIMNQYRPAYRSLRYAELSRMIADREFGEVLEYASSLGLHRGFPDKRETVN